MRPELAGTHAQLTLPWGTPRHANIDRLNAADAGIRMQLRAAYAGT
jgi:hypothetical protein